MKQDSEQIAKKIISVIQKYNSFLEDFTSGLLIDTMNGAPYDPASDIKQETEEEDAKYYVNKYIDELQRSSLKDNYYFFDCPFDVYMHHYPNRKTEFLENHIDIDESDFIKAELESRMDFKNERILSLDFDTVHYNRFLNYNRSIVASENKKIEFLESELQPLGWDAYVIEDENKIPSHYYFEKNQNYNSPFKDIIKLVSGVRRDLAKNTPTKEKEEIKDGENTIETTSSKTEIKETSNQFKLKRHKKIFTSEKGEEVFKRVMDLLNAVDDKGRFKRGSKAKANAIFSNEEFAEKYLIYDSKEQDFINYLIQEFKISETTNKLSDPEKHINKASSFINGLIKE